MKVFISWSGVASRAVAEALADWFPKVIQGVEPFVSAKDIDKGSNWTVELARELDGADFGVVCVAPDNLLSPWLNYEAGAIAKSVDSRVCPVLLGVEKPEVKPPISQLQMTSIELDDFKLLMASMNKSAGAPLSLVDLNEAVEIWWPRLQAALAEITVPTAVAVVDGVQEPAKPESTTHEMLTELLRRVRLMDSRLRHVERGAPLGRNASSHGAPARSVSDAVFDDIASALDNSSLSPVGYGVGHNSVTVQLDSPLPDPFPDPGYSQVGAVAKQHGVEVRLVGTDRTISFSRSGYADEPPF